MRPQPTFQILDTWEFGLAHGPTARSVALSGLIEPEALPEQLAQLPIGDRDTRLIDLREWAFGSDLSAVVSCPSCSTELEFNFSIDDIRGSRHTRSEAPARDGVFELRTAEADVRFRLPNSADVSAAVATASMEDAERSLLRACVVQATHRGTQVDPADLPEDLLAALQEQMAARDPQADVRLAVSCPECGRNWESLFDIGTFLWEEMDQWSRRLLIDVASLASAFGWAEEDILKLSPWRRQAYVELAGR
jgi:hypothetical protein